MILLLASALAADRVEGADTLAMGGASTANPYAMGGVNANPAVIGHLDRYTFGLGFSYGERGIHWQLGAIDTLTSAAAFGLTYSGDLYNPPLTDAELPGWSVPGQVLTNKKRNHDIGFALGAPFLDRALVFGLGGSLAFYNHERSGKGVTGNLHAGIDVMPEKWIAFGVSGRNLLPVENVGSDRPLEIVGGLWVGEVGIASFSFDGGLRPRRDSPLLLASGVEVSPTRASAVRAGWRLQDAVNHLTLGAGAGNPDGSIDLGLLVPTDRLTKPVDWTYLLSVRFKGPDINDVTPDG